MNSLHIIVQQVMSGLRWVAAKFLNFIKMAWTKYEATLESANNYIYMLILQILNFSLKKNKGNYYHHQYEFFKMRKANNLRNLHPAQLFDLLTILLRNLFFFFLFSRLYNFWRNNSLRAMKPFFIYWGKVIHYIIVSLTGTLEYITITKIYYTPWNYLFYKPNFTTYRTNKFFLYKNILVYNSVIVFYKMIKTIILPLLLTLIVSFLLVDFFAISFLKQLAVWFVVGCLFFWLISGFNFFLKRYRFGKFTSALQRFWKRANAYFWLIEGFLFLLFFYYYLNSSQEPIYMYDEVNLNQTYLFSLINTYQSYLLLVFIILYGFFFMFLLSTINTRQQVLHLLILTLCLIYIYLLENYQLYYILTSFFENFWLFDAELNAWRLEVETPRLRVKHQYLYLALIAKYWHFLFIFLSWLFMTIKAFEQKKISYIFFGVNIQNLIILFALNILFNLQWIKWLGRRYFDCSYFWFFTDTNMWYSYFYVNEFTNFFGAVLALICLCELRHCFFSNY